MALADNQHVYQCQLCGGVFTTGKTDKEAKEEYAKEFGPVITTHDAGVLVCDECYEKIDPSKFPELIEKTKEALINKNSN